MFLEFVLELFEIVGRSDVRIYLRRIRDVITVPAPFAAREYGRSIDVRDPEFRQIMNEIGSVRQPEIGIELKPVRCDWDGTFSHGLAH